MYHFISGALLVALIHSSFAQTSYTLIGAANQGVGNASAVMKNEWAPFNNPAGLTGAEHMSAGLTFDLMPGFPVFNRSAAAFTIPAKAGTFGAGIFRMGDDLLNETHLSVGYANTFGLASLGGRIQYMQYSAEGFGSRAVLSFSAGGIADLTPWLSVGAYVMNITQPELTDGEKIPTWMFAGILLKPIDKVHVMIEVEKELDLSATLKAGLSYQIHNKFVMRTGFNVNALTSFFGFGFIQKKFKVDYAFTYTPDFAARHESGIIYILKRKK